jgi:DeoR family galactitol utilization operon repressor
MNSFERRNKIVDLINTQGSVLVMDLSNTFGISEVTIRADLRLLEEKGLVTAFTRQNQEAIWLKATIRKCIGRSVSACQRS